MIGLINKPRGHKTGIFYPLGKLGLFFILETRKMEQQRIEQAHNPHKRTTNGPAARTRQVRCPDEIGTLCATIGYVSEH